MKMRINIYLFFGCLSFCVTQQIPYLHAQIDPHEIKEIVQSDANKAGFQKWLNNIDDPTTSLIAHNRVVEFARQCLSNSEFTTEIFLQLPEGSFKTALRLLFCLNKNNAQCIDIYNVRPVITCLVKFRKEKFGYLNLEGFSPEEAHVFDLLEYMLPLFEPISKCKVSSIRLSNNNLTSIPDSIKKLSNLETLYVDNNPLTQLPLELTRLPKLKRINISNTNITSPPAYLSHISFINIHKAQAAAKQA